MNYSVKTFVDFDKQVKRIAKKHKGIKADIERLIDDLEKTQSKAITWAKTFTKSG